MRISVCHLFLGLIALSLSRLLFDVCCHGEGSTVMAVSQVDDVGNRRQHRSLAAGANDGVSLTHCQQQLRSDDNTKTINSKWWDFSLCINLLLWSNI